MKVVVIGSGLDVQGLQLAGADLVGLPAPAGTPGTGERTAEVVVFMTQEAGAVAVEQGLLPPGWLTCTLPPEGDSP